jgi:chaperone modulatory protein CbpM
MGAEPENHSGETVLLDAHCEISLAELARMSGLAEDELRELVEYGALAPLDPRDAQWTFSGEVVVTVQTASRLRASFDLDTSALALALGYLQRIRALETELRALRAQFPRRVPGG